MHYRNLAVYRQFDEAECSIPGYEFIRLARNRHGGSVELFISNSLEFQVILPGSNGLELHIVSVYNAKYKLHMGV